MRKLLVKLIAPFVPTQEDRDQFKDALTEYTGEMLAMFVMGVTFMGGVMIVIILLTRKVGC